MHILSNLLDLTLFATYAEKGIQIYANSLTTKFLVVDNSNYYKGDTTRFKNELEKDLLNAAMLAGNFKDVRKIKKKLLFASVSIFIP